ncbi:acyl-ACP--UDP-N-acetylglucosamine O-acyltransferase [Endomicrobium proavitum]|uniref:UDP-N-acetylglucosamine acetyltransferase n=1 Tax=Endomicrobium proavitum TaxID=1408281 RepID=A0A0G3WIW5_9BACT|nr:acyl-ACP--UDP-N-acetylglucosamine O-acyltransferase [Endomicrobium proavitum]AKL97830.1 UDP-N-acetylglucosamine acetyltransferase [Endomicrobium proavitum]
MIHQTAVIDKSAVIDKDVEVGPYTVIGPETIIKTGTKIHGQCVIEYAEIGANCEIFNFSSIGKRPQDLKYKGEKTKVVIGDGTTVREGVTVNRGTSAAGQTIIGKNCLLMASAHVAHDCILGNNVIIGYTSGVAGHVEIGDDAILSGSVGVHQFSKIGKSAMISGGAMVAMDIIPYCVAQGDRAVLAGLNVIGLKRKQMKLSEIEDIKNAYRVLFMSKLPLNDALEKLESIASQYVKEITDFIKSSQRGIARPKEK